MYLLLMTNKIHTYILEFSSELREGFQNNFLLQSAFN